MLLKKVFAALAACLMLAMPAFAAGYLKLGDIKGESVAKGHENWIEISLVTEGAETAAASATGSARASNRVTILPVVVTKEIDSATPQIRSTLIAGATLKEVVIDYGDLKLEMKDVRITSVTSAVEGGRHEETVVLVPGQMTWSTAAAKGAGRIEASFNTRTGTP